eukprot:366249-Chlamydomonas_euryale.AAC.3
MAAPEDGRQPWAAGGSDAAAHAVPPLRLPSGFRPNAEVTRDIMGLVIEFLAFLDFPDTVAHLARERASKRSQLESSLSQRLELNKERLKEELVRTGDGEAGRRGGACMHALMPSCMHFIHACTNGLTCARQCAFLHVLFRSLDTHATSCIHAHTHTVLALGPCLQAHLLILHACVNACMCALQT